MSRLNSLLTRLTVKPLECAAPPPLDHWADPPPGWARSQRLLLRPLRPDDRDAFLELVGASRADLDLWCPLHRPGETDEQMFARQVQMTREGDDRGLAWRRVAELFEPAPTDSRRARARRGRLIGAFNLNSIVRGLEFEADATWWVGAPFAGRGLGAEGVRAMLRHAFLDLPQGLGLQCVHAGIAGDNHASERLARYSGFEREPGILSYRDFDGEWREHNAYTARANAA